MESIKPTNNYLTVDQEGFLIKQANENKFQEKWKSAIEDIKNTCITHFGSTLNSVYVRGSVARGQAIDGISDLDSIAIVNLPKEEIDTTWLKDFNKELVSKYTFMKQSDLVVVTPEHAISKERGIHIMLKTQAVCVYGEDISEKIPKLKPGRESAIHFKHISSELQNTLDFFEKRSEKNPDVFKNRCSWIMKRVLRTGFELVMEREQKYTRDLHSCYISFIKYYPEKRDDMNKILELAINPTDDPEKVASLLNTWLLWMPQKIEEILG